MSTLDPSTFQQNIKLSILLAEDDQVTRIFMEKILQKLGFEVYLAANGLEAYELFSHHCFNLILMDIQMPRLDGIEAVRRIRQLEKLTSSYTPVIALSANIAKSKACLEAGMDGFLSKPVSIPELQKTIHCFTIQKNESTGISGGRKKEPYTSPDNHPCLQEYERALKGLANDQALFEELLSILMENWEDLIGRINKAFECADCAEVAKALHSLKGSTGVFCNKSYLDDMTSFIRTAREGALPDRDRCMQRISREHEYLKALKDFHASHMYR
ncbi:MAG: response regulator [Fibrobacterota bacterium]